jgi:hypothetical protein
MTNNRFSEHIKSRKRHQQDISLQNKKTDQYLLKTSLDYKGTPLKEIFKGDDIKLCLEFIQLMREHNFPSTSSLKLTKKATTKLLNKSELNSGRIDHKKIHRITNMFRWNTVWEGVGYPIGMISDKVTIFPKNNNVSIVFLCSDHKLRCTRSHPLYNVGQSFGYGVGSLPVKELTNYIFKTGFFMADSEVPGVENFHQQILKELLIEITEGALLN